MKVWGFDDLNNDNGGRLWTVETSVCVPENEESVALLWGINILEWQMVRIEK